MENVAYVTVLSTENYYKGVIGLFESLKLTKSKCNTYVVVVNENISDETIEILKKYGYMVIIKPSIIVNEKVSNDNKSPNFSRWNYTFDKFNIFELTEFDKIVYLDSDMYIIRNIDELFECPNMSGVAAGQSYEGHSDWINLNSGLMVIEPKKGLINELLNVMNNVDFNKNIGDQDVIEEYFSWHNMPELKLSENYNMFACYVDYYIDKLGYLPQDIAVIHFVGVVKPWMMDENERKKYADDCINKNHKYQLEFFKKYIDIIDKSI